MKDLYKVLGVTKGASDKEIKSAYRKLAKKLHPDANPGDQKAEQQFKEISAAYTILGDTDKRAQYDAGQIDAEGVKRAEQDFYKAWTDTGGFKGSSGNARAGSFFADDLFADIFSSFGRRPTRAPLKQKGADVSYALRVSFIEAANGLKRRVSLANNKTLDVNIPAGTADGATLRLKGQGRPGLNGGTSGDAFIDIHVDPHPFFTRKENNIYVDVPIRLDEAVLGAAITVPTLSGKVSVKVPEGASTGTVLRLKGKGLKGGDEFVKLIVQIPKEPDKKLKEFAKSWGKSQQDDPRQKAGLL